MHSVSFDFGQLRFRARGLHRPDTDDLVATVIGDARVPATSAHPLGPDVPTGADFYGTHMLGVAKSIAGCVSRS